MKSATAACVALLAVLVAACDVRVDESGGIDLGVSQGRARDTWTRTYTVVPGGELEITNTLGRIEVVAADGPQVEVEAEREARARSDEAAQASLKSLSMIETVTPDAVRIEARLAQNEETMRGGLVVRYKARVPPGVRVSLKNDIGEILVTGLTSGLTASGTNGPIRGRGLSGPVEAATVNGPVELSFVRVNADVKAQTVNGGVDVRLPADASAVIEARAVNGGVRVDDGLTLQETIRERTSLRATLNAGGPTVSMAVTNGGVFVGTSREGAGGQPVEREPRPERRER